MYWQVLEPALQQKRLPIMNSSAYRAEITICCTYYSNEGVHHANCQIFRFKLLRDNSTRVTGILFNPFNDLSHCSFKKEDLLLKLCGDEGVVGSEMLHVIYIGSSWDHCAISMVE
jgi:hypothetical protein